MADNSSESIFFELEFLMLVVCLRVGVHMWQSEENPFNHSYEDQIFK